MGIVIWTQIANAFSMISPFIAWWSHRRNQDSKNKHLKRLRRTLIIHIPISFLYHFTSALGIQGLTRNILKSCDLSLVHLYALQARSAITDNVSRFSITSQEKPKLSTLLNLYCVVRVCKGYEDTRLRMTSLYACGHDVVRHVGNHKHTKKMVVLGVSSSILFYFDESLKNMGHSMFHILLGFLHNEIFGLVLF